ncbi:hypothetical protein BD311DRAFT_791565 [Dichomitus squalens]|uniref:DUF6533 domain-containing protein n=1 Tax=Dichomitus squalens TaxID=114155 RepID=A0A4Q9MCQ1_9APHY|nr:hypothetical protein BD311DRAFT_791565 [Dichomitus squalens]
MYSPALEAALLEDLLPTILKIRYAELASTVIILFDHVLTLDQEIHLIQHAHWSLGKLLFLLNRYYALCIVIFNNYVLFNTDTLSNSVCVHWLRWQGATGVITFIIAEMILQLRLYALYFRNKRILAAITFVSLGAAISSAYVMGQALSLITAVAFKFPLSGSTVCVPFGLPSNFYAFWIPMLISESFLCGLALYRGFDSFRPGNNVVQSGRRVLEILVRDSVSYFVIIFATYLTNAIVFLTRPDAEVEIPIGFAVALSTVMSSRLCLNVRGYIRDAAEEPVVLSGASIGPTSGPHHSRAHSGRSVLAFISFGYGTEEDERAHTASAASTVMQGAPLNDVEMRELRVMRAPSTKQMRVMRIGRREEGGGVK